MKVGINFTGGAELERALRSLDHAVAGRLGVDAARAGARVLRNAAKGYAPVDPNPPPNRTSGALRDSIQIFDDTKGNSRGGRERTVFVGSRLFYSYWVEFGTVKMAPRGFLRAARDNHAVDAVDALAQNLGDGIERETSRYR